MCPFEECNERDGDCDAPPPTEAKTLKADELFGPDREIWIEHNGERYRLRITRRGKLILQK